MPPEELLPFYEIEISKRSELPTGVSFVNYGNGTAYLFGIPEHNQEEVKDYYIAILGTIPGTCPTGECTNCVQYFTLRIESSPCDFSSPNSHHFRQTGHSSIFEKPFSVQIPEGFSGSITASGIENGVPTDLPTGILFTQTNGNRGTLTIFRQARPGCYQLRFSFSGRCTTNGCSSDNCTSEQDFFLRVGNPICSTPQPPRQVTGTVTQSSLYTTIRAKTKTANFDDLIKWKAPKKGSVIVGYNIFADRKMKKLLSSQASHKREKYKAILPNAKPCRSKTFFVASIDEFGRKSKPVKVVIPRSTADCKVYKKGHKDESSSSSSS